MPTKLYGHCVLDTPLTFWPLHWLSWLLSAVGIVSILLAHDHYTVDIVVAYLVATRLFWTYHTMASANVSNRP